jgi:hypothetical protein
MCERFLQIKSSSGKETTAYKNAKLVINSFYGLTLQASNPFY